MADPDPAENPYRAPVDSGLRETIAPVNYGELPWYRRSQMCSRIIGLHAILLLFGGCIPFGRLVSLVTMIGVIVICVSALTGPIYYETPNVDGTPRVWSKANKVAAVIILIVFLAVYAGIFYLILTATRQR